MVSRLGGDLRVRNPWTGSGARVLRDGKPAATLQGDLLTLQTGKGEGIRLERDGGTR